MKLKNRLIVTFIVTIFLPMILGAFLFGIMSVNSSPYQLQEDKNAVNINHIGSAVQITNRNIKETFNAILEVSRTEPEKLLEPDYQIELNRALEVAQSHLEVTKEAKTVYSGAPENEVGTYELRGYGEGDPDITHGYFVSDSGETLVHQVDFKYGDGTVGSFYVISHLENVVPFDKATVIQIMITILVILLLTAISTSIWIYRGIISPVQNMQYAAEQIKEGNLEHKLEINSKDELGKLSQSFEEMRIRLKDSAEEKLKQDKENKMLIRNICHDLKTPITSIQGYVEGILDGVAATPEKQEKYLRTVLSKSKEMNMLINELTVYSQIDTNRAVYNFTKLNVASYFEDCVEEISMDLEAQNIEMNYVNYANPSTLVIADQEQLRRVINNIVGNAVKYMNDGQRYIKVRIKDVGDFVQIEIEDSGKGIASKDLPYIFERFYRADESRGQTKGNGIGLSIVRKIIDDHGGKIWATSHENVGTTMYFVLRKYQEVRDE